LLGRIEPIPDLPEPRAYLPSDRTDFGGRAICQKIAVPQPPDLAPRRRHRRSDLSDGSRADGVSGSGKSTVAQELQRRLGWIFQEATTSIAGKRREDALRSAAQRRDRCPGCKPSRAGSTAIGGTEPGIITCSNLKRAYRRITNRQPHGVTLVYLRETSPVIQQRILNRVHRYMRHHCLAASLKPLRTGDDEHPVTVIVQGSIAETILDVLRQLAAPRS